MIHPHCITIARVSSSAYTVVRTATHQDSLRCGAVQSIPAELQSPNWQLEASAERAMKKLPEDEWDELHRMAVRTSGKASSTSGNLLQNLTGSFGRFGQSLEQQKQ